MDSLSSDVLSFHSKQENDLPSPPPQWFHHWYLPDGQISISVGREDNYYWVNFPRNAFFRINTNTRHITAYRMNGVPDKTIRHLLLDQIIPRLLSHLGEHIIHASCILTNNYAVAFCGASGWGKSTLGSFFHSSNGQFPLLTDDCLLLQPKNGKISCLASYPGVRLFQDSLSFLHNTEPAIPMAHYGNKKRILMTCEDSHMSHPLAAIFILNDPSKSQTKSEISITKIPGAISAIELLKNSFPLDITDKLFMGRQLQNLAEIAGNEFCQIYNLEFHRDHLLLPQVKTAILDTLSLNKPIS